MQCAGIEGAFAFVALSEDYLIGTRDPLGGATSCIGAPS